MKIKLTVVGGPTRKRAIELRSPKTIIGRARGSNIRVPSAEVSRRHCVLAVKDGFLTVEDLDSVNGTLLNGERITGKQRVQPGDQLQIGPLTFVADYHPSKLTRDKKAPPNPVTEEAPLELLEEPEEQITEEAPLELVEEPEEQVFDLAETESVAEPAPAAAEDNSDDELIVELDEDQSWHLPEGEDLRDILADLEE